MVNSADTNRVLVVGAGISGLLAARSLVDRGHTVLVLDKARGVGGRMSTRRIGTARVDHGAQFFTANDPAFSALVDRWLDGGPARLWSRGFANRQGVDHGQGRPAYRGLDGMSAIPRHLAAGLEVRTGCRLTSVSRTPDGFLAEAESGEAFTGGAALLTAPVPQSLALIEAGGIELPGRVGDLLRGIEYAPCFAVLAVLRGKSAIPAPGGLKLKDGPIEWMADNSQKGISPDRVSITIHATADFTRARLDADPEEVGKELLAAAAPWLGSTVEEVQVHRWLYSRPTTTTAERFLAVDPEQSGRPLVFAGDAFGGPAVEGAALSGLAAGEWLGSQIGGPR